MIMIIDQIMITVEYLSRKMNVQKCRDQLKVETSTKIMGLPNIDVLASRLSDQSTQYLAWKPDLNSIGTDALKMTWNSGLNYAFPTF